MSFIVGIGIRLACHDDGRLFCDGSIVGWHPDGHVQEKESKTQGQPDSR